jgi:hypothetical protein
MNFHSLTLPWGLVLFRAVCSWLIAFQNRQKNLFRQLATNGDIYTLLSWFRIGNAKTFAIQRPEATIVFLVDKLIIIKEQ